MNSPEPNRRLLAAAAVLLGGAVFWLTGDLAVAVIHPMPRAQIVRGAPTINAMQHDITMLHGEPMWDEIGTTELRNEGCPGDGTYDVLMLGSSIFYGTGVSWEDSMSTHLQRRLNSAEGAPWCVLNYGQPAMTSRGKLALGKAAIERFQPELVLWELWSNDPGGFTMIGPDAYNLTGLTVDADGYPVWLPLPSSLHHWLFRTSYLYEYATLAFSPAEEGAYERGWRRLLDETLTELRRLTNAYGGEVVLVFVPRLSVPFEESAELHRTHVRGYMWTAEWAAEQGVDTYDVAVGLSGQSVEALRGDLCCHYSEAGHAAVGVLLEEEVRAHRREQEETR